MDACHVKDILTRLRVEKEVYVIPDQLSLIALDDPSVPPMFPASCRCAAQSKRYASSGVSRRRATTLLHALRDLVEALDQDR